MKKGIQETSEIFKLLSNEVRLCIVVNLHLNGEKKVNELKDCSGASQSFVSQQLAKLKSAGIIKSRKEGQQVYYSLSNEQVSNIINNLKI